MTGNKIHQLGTNDFFKAQRLSERAKGLIDTLMRIPEGEYEEDEFFFGRVVADEGSLKKDGWSLQLVEGLEVPLHIADELARVINLAGESPLECSAVAGGDILDRDGNLIQKEIILMLNRGDAHPEVLSFVCAGREGIHWMDVDSNTARSPMSHEAQEWILSMLSFTNEKVGSLGIIPPESSTNPLDPALGKVIAFTGSKTEKNLL